MRFLGRALTGLFLLSLTLGGLAYAGLTLRGALQDRADAQPGSRPAREQVFAANIVTIIPETIAPELVSFGQIEARRTLDLRAPASGRIVEMPVEEGQTVKAGDLLFAIDPTDAQRVLALAEADLADAQAELQDATSAAALAQEDVEAARSQAELRERAAARQRDLSGRGVGTAAAVEETELAAASARQQILSRRQALQQAQARVASARTALTRRQIALDDAQRLLDDTRITAAFDGTVSDVAVSEGGLVSGNEQLAVLLDPDRLEIAFSLSTPEYVRLLQDGQLATDTATVSLEVGGYTLVTPAVITREAAAVGEGETGRRLFARLEEPQGFRPGDFARIRVTEPDLSGVARLPAGAVDNAGTVLVLGEDERLQLASVTRLRAQGDTVLVRAPDLAGQEVVADRSALLGPGIKVRPLRQSDDEPAVPSEDEVVDLTPERRAALIALVEGNAGMPDAAKARVLAALQNDQVPARIVERLEGARDG